MERPINYLKATRRDTCYPTFRAAITLLAAIAYALIALCVAIGFFAGLRETGTAPLVIAVTLGVAVLAIGVVKLLSEASLMFVDLVDVVIERSWSNLPDANSAEEPAPNLNW